jgi:hypothetical protein
MPQLTIFAPRKQLNKQFDMDVQMIMYAIPFLV